MLLLCPLQGCLQRFAAIRQAQNESTTFEDLARVDFAFANAQRPRADHTFELAELMWQTFRIFCSYIVLKLVMQVWKQ